MMMMRSDLYQLNSIQKDYVEFITTLLT